MNRERCALHQLLHQLYAGPGDTWKRRQILTLETDNIETSFCGLVGEHLNRNPSNRLELSYYDSFGYPGETRLVPRIQHNGNGVVSCVYFPSPICICCQYAAIKAWRAPSSALTVLAQPQRADLMTIIDIMVIDILQQCWWYCVCISFNVHLNQG